MFGWFKKEETKLPKTDWREQVKDVDDVCSVSRDRDQVIIWQTEYSSYSFKCESVDDAKECVEYLLPMVEEYRVKNMTPWQEKIKQFNLSLCHAYGAPHDTVTIRLGFPDMVEEFELPNDEQRQACIKYIETFFRNAEKKVSKTGR